MRVNYFQVLQTDMICFPLALNELAATKLHESRLLG